MKAWSQLSPHTKSNKKKFYNYLKMEIEKAQNVKYTVEVSVTDGTNPLSAVQVILTGADGTFKGKTGSKGGTNISDVVGGTYSVKATKTGYEDYTGSLTVSENTSLDITMTAVQEEQGPEENGDA